MNLFLINFRASTKGWEIPKTILTWGERRICLNPIILRSYKVKKEKETIIEMIKIKTFKKNRIHFLIYNLNNIFLNLQFIV